MTIFDVLTLIGGLCLFLFGMSVMGDALERSAGSKLKVLLGKLTGNRIKGLLTGLGVTSIIQSSSATTVMVVGFVNSNLMTLKQAIGVIMGANIGTTVTAWILSLGGISDDNIVLQLLKPMSFTPVLALIGIALFMFCKDSKKKDIGTILLGFAVLMFGMDIMTGAVAGLADVPEFQQLFIMFQNPILGVLAGAILTAIIQSSSASVGILQALAMTGQVTFGAAIPIIMGQNIGTCITAILSSFGTNRNAKRAALVHLSFNVIGTIVWLTTFTIVDFIFAPALFDQAADMAGIAIAHSSFNILCTILLLPMASLLEKLAYKLIPEKEAPEKAAELDERLITTPAVALERCHNVVQEMAGYAVDSVKESVKCLLSYSEETEKTVRELEDKTDHFEDIVATYLVKLSAVQINDSDSAQAAMLLKAIGDFERISDHATNLVDSAKEMNDKDFSFSPAAREQLGKLTDAVCEILDLSIKAFIEDDVTAVVSIEPLEEVIDKMKEKMRSEHILRLQQGSCSIEMGFVWSDILTNLERISDHCSNVAGCIIDSAANNLNVHESLKAVKRNNKYFDKQYEEYHKKYIGEI